MTDNVRVASPLRRGRGSQLTAPNPAVVGDFSVASPLRRGRGSQPGGAATATAPASTWRPLFGGDEDRNPAERALGVGGLRGVPSSEGTRIATSGSTLQQRLALRTGGVPSSEGTRIATRLSAGETDVPAGAWRPLFGGDEDRNNDKDRALVGEALCGVPSSEGTRIATRYTAPRDANIRQSGVPSSEGTRIATGWVRRRSPPPARSVASPLRRGRGSQPRPPPDHRRYRGWWRPLFGGDEDRNQEGRGTGPGAGTGTGGVPSSEGTRIATSPTGRCRRTLMGGVPSSEGTRIATGRRRRPGWWRSSSGVPSSEGTRIATRSARLRFPRVCLRGVPSSEGTRIATCSATGCSASPSPVASPLRRGRGSQHRVSPRRWWAMNGVASPLRRGRGSQLDHCQPRQRRGGWRPLFGGDEDRNLQLPRDVHDPGGWRPLFGGDEDRNALTPAPSLPAARVASPLRRGRGSQPCPPRCSWTAPSRVASPLRRGRGSQLQSGPAGPQ